MAGTRTLPKPGMVGNLFSGHHGDTGWRAPVELPSFSQFPVDLHFGFDSEFKTHTHNSVDSELAGMSICTPDKKKYYLPVGHRGGGNLDENAVRRWARNELRGRHLSILNAKGDYQVLQRWGVDFEELGCTLHDPAFKAALLDENRRRFNLEELSQDILKRGKTDHNIRPTDIFDCSAAEIGPYAENDAELHLDLDLAQQPEINAQGLDKVCDLEDQLIFCTASMESTGAKIDLPKLERWIREVDQAHETAILSIWKATGLKVNPNSTEDLKVLFDYLHLPYPRFEEELGGGVTFGEEYISQVNHPVVRSCIAARKLHSLNSKYLKKYRKLLDFNNVLRYTLHQLRSDDYGTVTGRYASSGGRDQKGVNIQQVMKVENQLEEEEIAAWIVRELFIPEEGSLYVAADASQIEFRWFAHYSKSERLIKEYNLDPTMDFHQLVANLLGQKRKDAKHNNFGKLYTMGIPKLARKLGLHCDCGCAVDEQWNRKRHTTTCRMHKAFEIADQYDERFPEAQKLSKEAMHVAKNRGYVRTRMGRRRRYPDGQRLHTALNAIIQGTAADTLKVKLLETFRNRRFLSILLRATVHDELDGDLQNPDRAKDFKELLEAPDERISCRVPLLWDVVVGRNWRECTE